MKTKLLTVALVASAALIAPVYGGGHHGNGGGNYAASGRGPSRSSGGPSFRSAPMRSYSGGGMRYSGQRFSSAGVRAFRSTNFQPHYVNSNVGSSISSRQFSAGNINRCAPIGGITSSRNTRAIGTIGVAIRTIGGTDIVATSLTGPGSSSTSDIIRGGRGGITRPIITHTITATVIRISTVTTKVITTRARITTGTAIPINIRPVVPMLRQPSRPSRSRDIIVVRSTA
jgi:hypothetical protein